MQHRALIALASMRKMLQVLLLAMGAVAVAAADEPISDARGMQLLAKYNCLACHAVDSTLTGPSLRAVAKRYSSDPEAIDDLEGSVLNGSSGAWGDSAMPSNDVPDADLRALINWILQLM